MKHSTRDNICAAIGLFLVIVLLTTAAALDDPVVPDAPAAATQDVTGKLPSEDKPAAGCASIELGELLGEFRVTAYCPCTYCCNKADGITATGTVATEGRTIAVDPDVIPYGSTVTLYFADGSHAQYVAEDTGSAIKAQCLDVFFADHQTAREFGVQTAYVFIVSEGENNE